MEPENDFFDMLWVDTSPTYFKVTDDGYLETPLKKLDEYTSQYGGNFFSKQMPQHEIDSAGPWQQAVMAAGYPQKSTSGSSGTFSGATPVELSTKATYLGALYFTVTFSKPYVEVVIHEDGLPIIDEWFGDSDLSSPPTVTLRITGSEVSVKRGYNEWKTLGFLVNGPDSSGSSDNGMNTINELEEALPGTEAMVYCPGEITDPGIRCTTRSIWLQVQHLNDFHRWSREKIADWVDELIDAGYDLAFKVPEEEA